MPGKGVVAYDDLCIDMFTVVDDEVLLLSHSVGDQYCPDGISYKVLIDLGLV